MRGDDVGAFYNDTSDARAATLPDLGCRRSSVNVSACPQKNTQRQTKTTSRQTQLYDIKKTNPPKHPKNKYKYNG